MIHDTSALVAFMLLHVFSFSVKLMATVDISTVDYFSLMINWGLSSVYVNSKGKLAVATFTDGVTHYYSSHGAEYRIF